jgi:lipopolysaccharide biosynthesis protein
MSDKVRAIAMYLPQFHPVKENDEWWGKGFTEWTNVTKAQPLFEGHYQPHLPADLGFYDLRLHEARQAQADLAKAHGIYGFCYYHYWFNGRRILERPFTEVFESGKPDFPFMLCWANENWTKRWDGNENEILLNQDYSLEDDLKHIQSLIPYFKDPRYITIDNKPVFAIYRSTEFPDMKATIRIWREEAAKHDLELYICRFEGFTKGKQYLEDGFDAGIDFQPIGSCGEYLYDLSKTYVKKNLSERIINKIIKEYKKVLRNQPQPHNRIEINYNDFANWVMSKPYPDYVQFPGITPSWDNSARRKEPLIMKDANPTKYGEWLKHIVENFVPNTANENLIFINAWNEWAEGNHLEPDRKWGRDYLEQTKEKLR